MANSSLTKYFNQYISLDIFGRAFVDVFLINPTNNSLRAGPVQCLIDTGSDFTILPIHYASSININPSYSTSIRTPGGTAKYSSERNLALEICNLHLPNVNILFSSSSGFISILGRNDLLSTIAIGMDDHNWYWE